MTSVWRKFHHVVPSNISSTWLRIVHLICFPSTNLEDMVCMRLAGLIPRLLSTHPLVLMPRPSRTCEKESLVFWATFLVTAPPIWELQSDCRTICDDIGNWAQDSVCMQCIGNAIITFFMPLTPPQVTRKVIQNIRPSFCFSGGSGHETTTPHAVVILNHRQSLPWCTFTKPLLQYKQQKLVHNI